MKDSKFLFFTYEMAKDYLKDKNISSQRCYTRWVKENNTTPKLPANPRKFYKNEWIGWCDYINSGNIPLKYKEFLTYDECSKFVMDNNIKTKREYKSFVKNNNKLPSCPDITYSSDWKSWNNFLNGKDRPKKLTYIEAKDYLKDKNILSSKDYVKYIEDNNIDFLIKYPSKYVEFEGYDIYLNNNFISYDNAKSFLKDKKLKNRREYTRWHDDNNIIKIPKIPHKYYKEFISYDDFLTNVDKYSKFIKYDQAVEYVKDLNIKTQRDYKEWQRKNKIDFLPNWPDGVYEDWAGWIKFLNTSGYESTGESLINRFLIENNINFVKQKKFEDCVNRYKLSFDFYLPDYNTCIEYNGEQHYKSVQKFGGESRLEYQKINDIIKEKYCKVNNINLIIIPYTFIKNIDSILSQFIKKNNIEYGFI